MLKVSEFVKRVPQDAKPLLPKQFRDFRVTLMPWLAQVYYTDKFLHYEVVKLPDRYGKNRVELGLHFESRDRELNMQLLRGFQGYLFEIRDVLGEDWWAEPWDRGWTKIYTAFTYESLDTDVLAQTAEKLASAIKVMQPIYQIVSHS